MGKYFEAVEPYFASHCKLAQTYRPPMNVAAIGVDSWREGKALDLVFGLSGIVYVGVLSSLNYITTSVDKARLPLRNTRGRKKIIQESIEARRIAISQLFPTDETNPAYNKDLSLIGIVGLGLIRTIFPDRTGEAMIRLSAISILLKNDPFAVLIREQYPEAFNGLKDVNLLLREQNLIRLPAKQLKIIYNTLNL